MQELESGFNPFCTNDGLFGDEDIFGDDDYFCSEYEEVVKDFKYLRTISRYKDYTYNNNFGLIDDQFILQDKEGRKYTYTKERVKEIMKYGNVYILDLQLDKSNRLVSKKVEYTGLHYSIIKGGPEGQKEALVFYGLAKINQLSVQQKMNYIRMIQKMNTIYEIELESMFIENHSWSIERYKECDEICRFKILEILCLILGLKDKQLDYYRKLL